MTKSKAKTAAKETKKAEKYILRSGSHSRKEADGLRHKYECGDTLSVSAEELRKFPLRFMTLSEYDEFLAADARRRQADRQMNLAQFPPRVLKRGMRSAEALTRQRKLNNSRRRSGRRILL